MITKPSKITYTNCQPGLRSGRRRSVDKDKVRQDVWKTANRGPVRLLRHEYF